MAESSKIPILPSISPRPPQKEFANLRQTVDIMLRQIHANQEAIRARDDEIVALRMELFEVKKATNDKIYRMSNNIRSLKQQVNDLRQRESVISDVENELKNFTSKQDELMSFQERQDSKLSEMECSIIDSCHRAIADIRTKQLRETEETSQSQIKSMTKITSVQGILRSNVQSVQTLLEKKTREDNRRFQNQENWMQTLQPKIDQALNLETSFNKMMSWRKAKTETDKKLFEQLTNKIVHLQSVLASKQFSQMHNENDHVDRKNDDSDIIEVKKPAELDDTIQERIDKEIHNLKSRIKDAEGSIFGISKWQRDKLDNDKKSHEGTKITLEELQQKMNDLENKNTEENKTEDIPNKVEAEKETVDESDHGRMIARLKRRTDTHDELLQILEERVALTTTNSFQVSLHTTQDLQVGQRVKLDKCLKVWFDNNDLFDKGTCCMVPRNNCKVALAWRLVQCGEGEMEAWMGVDGVEEGDYLGKTTKENEVMSGILMWGVKKGQKIWMEVERGRGDAALWNCLFMAWVVGR